MLQPFPQLKPPSAMGPSTFKCEQTAVEQWSRDTEPTKSHSTGPVWKVLSSRLILQAIQLSVTVADTVWFAGAVLSLL